VDHADGNVSGFDPRRRELESRIGADAAGGALQGLSVAMQRRDGSRARQRTPLVQGLAHCSLVWCAPQRLQWLLERVDRGQRLVGLHQCFEALGAGCIQTLFVAQQQVQAALDDVLAVGVGFAEFGLADFADHVAVELHDMEAIKDDMYVATAQAAFPRAKTWICPGIERRRRSRSLKYDGLLGDVAPVDWAGEIDQALVLGTRIMREVAMFHRASRTLILVDLIENFTDATPHTGGGLKFWFKYVFRMWNNPLPAPEYRMGWSDRQAAAKSLRHILGWDFHRIVLSHGDLIERAAREVAIKAWVRILEG